jgi:hypothetical protein
MAGSEKAEKTKGKRKRRKKEKHLSDQLESKWLGSRADVLERISIKEAEIRSRTKEEKEKADRLIEDAKGEAASIKREATFVEAGEDVYEEIVAASKENAGEIEDSTAQEIAAVRETGRRNLDKAVDFIVKAVISSGYSNP